MMWVCAWQGRCHAPPWMTPVTTTWLCGVTACRPQCQDIKPWGESWCLDGADGIPAGQGTFSTVTSQPQKAHPRGQGSGGEGTAGVPGPRPSTPHPQPCSVQPYPVQVELS